MNLEQLKSQLLNYRKWFNERWRPYPPKGTKEYLEYYPYVMKGLNMVRQIEKFGEKSKLKVEDMSDNQVDNIFA